MSSTDGPTATSRRALLVYCSNPIIEHRHQKISILIRLNSKHFSQSGDGECDVHARVFSDCHVQLAVRCDQCAQIVLGKHTPIKKLLHRCNCALDTSGMCLTLKRPYAAQNACISSDSRSSAKWLVRPTLPRSSSSRHPGSCN